MTLFHPDFTASINAELKVGALEETITVSGASPLVDMQAVTKQTAEHAEAAEIRFGSAFSPRSAV